MKNKTIAKVVSDAVLVLADYTDRIVELYPGLAGTSYCIHLQNYITYIILLPLLMKIF